MPQDRMRVGLLGVGAYAPERVMTNEEWTRWVDTSDEWITQRTGIKRRRIAAPDESTADLAVAAARRALAAAGIGPREVDEIIVATDTPEVYLPDTASFVQHRLGAREVPAYDLGGSGCAGFLQALDVARSRVLAGRGRVLVVGVELLTRLMNWRDRSTCVLFGDAGGAAVVGELDGRAGEAGTDAGTDAGARGEAGGGREAEAGVGEIIAVTAGTDGSRWEILTLEVGGTRKPFTLERARENLHQAVVMKGREVFKEAVTRMTQSAREVLEQAGRALDQVALLVPHQANLRILQAVGKSLGLPAERVFVNVQDYGNTGSASIPLALAQALEERRIRRGDLVLLTSFGAGFHWASALVQY